MKCRQLHRWDLSPREAIALQGELAGQVGTTDRIGPVRRIAGVDMAIRGDTGIAAVVVMRFPDLTVEAEYSATAALPFPYVPGLLSFREIPVLVAAFATVEPAPDLVFVDGQGRMHPRGLGLAAHLGLCLDLPTIGCAKSRLCGEHPDVPAEKGARQPVTLKGETIGVALRTRADTRPMYISGGHRVSLATAIDYVLAVSPRYRIPEPTRRAHQLGARVKATIPR